MVWTVVRYATGLEDGGLFVRKVPALACVAAGAPGDWGSLTLAPEPGDTVIVKQYASAFFGTSLASALHDNNLADLDAKYADVIGLREALTHL